MAHEDRSRDDQDDPQDPQGRSGLNNDPDPDESGQKPAERPSELDDPDAAAEENWARLRRLGRG